MENDKCPPVTHTQLIDAAATRLPTRRTHAHQERARAGQQYLTNTQDGGRFGLCVARLHALRAPRSGPGVARLLARAAENFGRLRS